MDRAEDLPGDEWQPLHLPTSLTLKRTEVQSPRDEDERFESPMHEDESAPSQHLQHEDSKPRAAAASAPAEVAASEHPQALPSSQQQQQLELEQHEVQQVEQSHPPQPHAQHGPHEQHTQHEQHAQPLPELSSPPRLGNGARSPAAEHPSPPAPIHKPSPTKSLPESPLSEQGRAGRQELLQDELLLLHKSVKRHGSSFSSISPVFGGAPQPAKHVYEGHAATAGAQLSQWKEWASKTLRTSWQALNERLGNAAPTVDGEVQDILDSILKAQKAYENIQRLVSLLINHFEDVVRVSVIVHTKINTKTHAHTHIHSHIHKHSHKHTFTRSLFRRYAHNYNQVQKQLSTAFGELEIKSPELADVFNCNHDAQRTLHKNGLSLIGAMTFFVQNLHTLTSKTMEDTIRTYRELHSVRLEYDAFKQTLAGLEGKGASHEKLIEAGGHVERTHKRLEELREVFKLKAQLLDENRLKVVHKQMLLFHNATCAFFAGNQTQLEEVMSKFHVPHAPQDGAPAPLPSSW
jgi:hypothetical protein